MLKAVKGDLVKRKELHKAAYNLFRTCIEVPGCNFHWYVNTIDVRKLHEQFREKTSRPSFQLDAFKQLPRSNRLYQTVVYRSFEENEKMLPEVSFPHPEIPPPEPALSAVALDPDPSPKPKKVYFHKGYETFEEAQFGHEEVVYSILSGRFFMEHDDELSDYLLFPDSGEEFSGKVMAPILNDFLDLEEDPDFDEEN